MNPFLNNLQSTIVFATYWRLAAERHGIYSKRLQGEPEPWTSDPILREYKFTNTFRAADRVSQYCIRDVIYGGGSMDPQELVFRVALFKLFNSIPAWETLTAAFGPLTWENFDAVAYGDVLGKAKARDVKIWNAAYIQKPQTGSNFPDKHSNYLDLLERMMRSAIADKLQASKNYEEAYRVFRDFPSPAIGDFTAMQLVTDINYSPMLNFSENDFIVKRPPNCDRDHHILCRTSGGPLPTVRSRTGDSIRTTIAPDRLPIARLRNGQICSYRPSRVQSEAIRD